MLDNLSALESKDINDCRATVLLITRPMRVDGHEIGTGEDLRDFRVCIRKSSEIAFEEFYKSLRAIRSVGIVLNVLLADVFACGFGRLVLVDCEFVKRDCNLLI